MKTVARVKLLPDADTHAALVETLRICNAAATTIAADAFGRGITRRYDMQKVFYGQAKAWGLSAQPALHVIRKVADAYTTRKANARAGNYGKRGCRRYETVMGKPVVFRDDAAQPFDDRCLSWDHSTRTVSIWTTSGRVRVPFLGKRSHMRAIAAHRAGETDLVCRDGVFYLIATLDQQEPAPTVPAGYMGVDLGQTNLATTDDGAMHGADKELRSLRVARVRERASLQKVGTKAAKRKLKAKSGRESRRMTDTNHRIAKTLVAEAERTGRGIALENLTGIRDRVRHRQSQRGVFHSWAFAQLAAFITYKARAAGLDVQIVDAAYTSQQCGRCGHTERGNRPSQDRFRCRSCGHAAHADVNAAVNIAARGWDQYQQGAWAQAA